ncbi:hypothetical protein [Lysobacter capsici]|uniref:hypothetical protein n=1 Tax=Lysobacter capsici TaxID=435897 RepID=UPI001C000B26|nr:hypothetical protein [Lysobacter capsici]QWF16904.1 hypothetical protein KME82_24760 [Lysobacter capsici]
MAWNLERNNLHWHYFLAIESDLVRVSRFVEFHKDNMQTFSIELARVLLATCAKVEVVGKLIAHTHNIRPRKIDQIRDALMSKYPHISAAQVFLPRHDLTLTPWSAWAGNKSPNWWVAYNSLKHDHKDALSHASLASSLESLGGLLVLVLLYCRISGTDALMPATELIYPPNDFGVGAMTPNGRVIDLRNASH